MKQEEILNLLLLRYPQFKNLPLFEAYAILSNTYHKGGKILLCGNGGCASDAEHIVGELMKGFLQERKLNNMEKEKFGGIPGGPMIAANLQKAIPAISLNSQTSLMTAIGNDICFEMIYAQQVYAYGRKEDCLFVLSTSGKSEDILAAVITAKALGIKSVCITGEGKSPIRNLCDVKIALPSYETYLIQEYGLAVYHTLCAMLESDCFGE